MAGRQRGARRGFPFAGLYLALVLILMYLPVIVVAVYSFNANTGRFPTELTGFSFHYYGELLRDTKGLLASLRTSLLLALISCGAAVVIGTLGAVGLTRGKLRTRGAIETMSVLPVMIPEIILGMAFLAVFTAVGFKFGLGTLALAHITFCTPYVFLLVKGRLAGLDPELESAARDLGASPRRAFMSVTLPLILPGVLSGAMLAFAMSLDDFVISFFVTGSNVTTLPLKIYSSVKTGVSPQVNALCTLTVAVIFLLMGLRFALRGRAKRRRGAAAETHRDF